MSDIIQQKIENREGQIQLQNHGLVDAKTLDENNHPIWDQATIDEFQSKWSQIKLDCGKDTDKFDKVKYKVELAKLNKWLNENGVAQNADWQDWADDPIVWQPTKNDYELKLKEDREEGSENPEDYDLVLKEQDK